MGKLEWHGDEVQSRIRAEMLARIATCCSLVATRAKQLLNVEGTGVRRETSAELGTRLRREGARRRRADAHAEAKAFNERHAAGISIGAIKRRRVTKSGFVTHIRAARKKE